MRKQVYHKSKPKQTISIRPTLSSKDREKMQSEIFEKSMLVLSGVPLIVLIDTFGFGKKRLTRFAEEFLKQLKCVENGAVTLEDLHEVIKKETGFEIFGLIEKG